VAALRFIVYEQPAPFHAVSSPEQVPLPVQNLTLRALAKHPAHRYQTASEMRRDIEHLLDCMNNNRALPKIAAPPPDSKFPKALAEQRAISKPKGSLIATATIAAAVVLAVVCFLGVNYRKVETSLDCYEQVGAATRTREMNSDDAILLRKALHLNSIDHRLNRYHLYGGYVKMARWDLRYGSLREALDSSQRGLDMHVNDIGRNTMLQQVHAYAMSGLGETDQAILYLNQQVAATNLVYGKDNSVAQELEKTMSDIVFAATAKGDTSALPLEAQLGEVHALMQDKSGYRKAISLTSEIIAKHPHCADAFVMRGLCRYWSGEVTAGMADMDSALTIDPANYDAMIHKANMLKNMHKTQEALQLLEQTILKQPQKHSAYAVKIEHLLQLHRTDEAASVYETTRAKLPPDEATKLNNSYRKALDAINGPTQ
jgi:tetratricopeptide (TPR) repeat protein